MQVLPITTAQTRYQKNNSVNFRAISGAHLNLEAAEKAYGKALNSWRNTYHSADAYQEVKRTQGAYEYAKKCVEEWRKDHGFDKFGNPL